MWDNKFYGDKCGIINFMGTNVGCCGALIKKWQRNLHLFIAELIWRE